MIIRDETAADVEVISEITKAAFADHPFSRQTEHLIIHALRAAGMMSVSLVAEKDSEVVGHVAFSPVTFADGSEGWYGLGPVSVRPDRQRQGIGVGLVKAGLERLKELGGRGCVLVGDPAYYQQFGFASHEGLEHEGVPQENVLALSFCGKVPTGMAKFHEAFGVEE